jgi:DnaK suppressor protein
LTIWINRARIPETASLTEAVSDSVVLLAELPRLQLGSDVIQRRGNKMAVTIDELGRRLKEERGRLAKALEQMRAGAPPIGEAKEGSPYGKKEEGATEAFELEKRLALEKRLMALIGEVEHALQKFKDGTYGLCDVCGQSVEMARLEVLPQATLCLGCKAKQERSAKGKLPSR